MTTESIPVGTAALHPDWPQARFNISGMFAQDVLIFQYLDVVWRDLDCVAPIETVHGSPPVRWNAGRLSRIGLNPARFRENLAVLYSRGVGYFPTFTNHLLTGGDLGDPACNFILECISQRPDLNGVIVASDELSRYIASRYPGLRQIASVIKATVEGGIGRAEYYQELGKRFWRYVVDPDDSRNPELMGQLDRDKAEILVNENCIRQCPNRAQHYEAYARLQRASVASEQQMARQQASQIAAGCRSQVNMTRVGHHEESCNLTRHEMKTIYEMGFRHFKLQGRADDPFSYAYDLTRFTLEPDFAAPRIFKLLVPWLCTAVSPTQSGDRS